MHFAFALKIFPYILDLDIDSFLARAEGRQLVAFLLYEKPSITKSV